MRRLTVHDIWDYFPPKKVNRESSIEKAMVQFYETPKKQNWVKKIFTKAISK